MRRTTRVGLAVILVSFFLPLIALMFAEKVGESFVLRLGSIEQRPIFEQFPIGRDHTREPGLVPADVAGATLLLDRDLPKDEADRAQREFSRLYGRDAQAKGTVYVFKGWTEEARHALPYRYVVAAALTVLLAGLLTILLGGTGRETVPNVPDSSPAPEDEDD